MFKKKVAIRKITLIKRMLIGLLVWGCSFHICSAFAEDIASPRPLELNGTEWAIEIVSSDANGAKKTEADTLVFKDDRFFSKIYSKKGYAPTSYSLSVNGDNRTSFGTMQIKDQETIFWKGDITGKKIAGTIHIQYPSGGNVTYNFDGMLSKGGLRSKV